MHPADATLYERLGGCYGIAGAVDVLVDRLFMNVKVNANDKVHEHHGNPANAGGYKFLVTAWSIEAVGGPKCYIGHDMSVAHEHLSIDKDGFDAVYMEIEATLMYLGRSRPGDQRVHEQSSRAPLGRGAGCLSASASGARRLVCDRAAKGSAERQRRLADRLLIRGSASFRTFR